MRSTGEPLLPSSAGGVKVIESPSQCPSSRERPKPNSTRSYALNSEEPSIVRMYSALISSGPMGRGVHDDVAVVVSGFSGAAAATPEKPRAKVSSANSAANPRLMGMGSPR